MQEKAFAEGAHDGIEISDIIYVNGEKYEEGTASSGTAVEITVSSSGSSENEGMPQGERPEGMPEPGQGEPPAKPD